MRESRLYGSEGGVARAIPTPIRSCAPRSGGRKGRGERMVCLFRSNKRMGYKERKRK